MQKLSNRMQVLHKKFAEQWLVLFLISGLFISTILKIAKIGPDVSDVIVYILFGFFILMIVLAVISIFGFFVNLFKAAGYFNPLPVLLKFHKVILYRAKKVRQLPDSLASDTKIVWIYGPLGSRYFVLLADELEPTGKEVTDNDQKSE